MTCTFVEAAQDFNVKIYISISFEGTLAHRVTADIMEKQKAQKNNDRRKMRKGRRKSTKKS